MPRKIVWFRQDLRLQDNPALFEAAQQGEVVPVYILDINTDNKWPLGEASKWWLHKSLQSLQGSHIPLILKKGDPLEILEILLKETQADEIYWNRCYEPYAIERDNEIEAKLGCVKSFNGSLLYEPWTIQTKTTNSFYKVFTPFWKACLESPDPRPILELPKVKWMDNIPSRRSIEDLDLIRKSSYWSDKLQQYWNPGETGAWKRLNDFIENKLHNYDKGRDIPGEEWTSHLSPHLHFGELSPNQIWEKIHQKRNSSEKNTDRFLTELGWREFSYHLLYHFPQLPDTPFQKKYGLLPWKTNEAFLDMWKRGKTGIPLVDAGMRELWQTGYMHNRIRMIVASFLTKHGLIPWQEGEAWFWDTLVDADLANNSASWQWVAGCGADAAPFFRIFNPLTQSQKFDPEGNYIRRWVPELKDFSNREIHAPWLTSMETQKRSNCTIGKDYPHPIIELEKGRKLALEAYHNIKMN